MSLPSISIIPVLPGFTNIVGATVGVGVGGTVGAVGFVGTVGTVGCVGAVGFVGYGDRGDEAPNTGEIFALYVLAEYYGKGVAQQLMKAGLQQLMNYPQICLWVLKENKRAIRFYEKNGFRLNGEEKFVSSISAGGVKMVKER